MKPILCLLLINICSVIAFGQKGVFIAFGASGGIGGNIHDNYSHNNYYTSSSVFTYSIDARVGYRFGNNLELSSGISFFKSGLENKTETQAPFNITPYAERFTYGNIYVPLALGYSFRLSEKMRLVPSINVGASYLLSAKYLVETEYSFQEKLSKTELQKNYYPIRFWAGAALLAEHSFGERFSLYGGYRFNSMLQKLTRPAFANNNDHHQLIIVSGELGFKYRF